MTWRAHRYVMPSHRHIEVDGYLSTSMRWHVRREGAEWRVLWIPLRLSLGALVHGSCSDVQRTMDLADKHMGDVTPGEALWSDVVGIARIADALEHAVRSGAAAVDRVALTEAWARIAATTHADRPARVTSRLSPLY